MDGKIQPSVAVRQQLPVQCLPITMQPMVVDSPEAAQAKNEFKRWFLLQISGSETGERGAVARAFKRLKDVAGARRKPLVTYQQLQKYAKGRDIPKPHKLKQLCEQLNLSPPPQNFTRMIAVSSKRPPVDELFEKLRDLWEEIADPGLRQQILEFAEFKAWQSSRVEARTKNNKRGSGDRPG